MPFTKGTSGNVTGRPLGSTNRATTQLRSFVAAFLEQNKNELQTAWAQLEARDKFLAFEKLLRFVLPAKSQIDIDRLSPEDVDEILNKIQDADDEKK